MAILTITPWRIPRLVLESVHLKDEGTYRVEVEKDGKRYSSNSFVVSVVPVSLEVFGAVCLEWAGEEGMWFQVQVSGDLEKWEDFGEPIMGRGETVQVFQKSDPLSPRFYRLKPLDL